MAKIINVEKSKYLNENIKRAIKDIGYENLTKIQENTINLILNNEDVVAMSNTGSGKTAAFMLPLIEKINTEEKATQVIVVTPTRELAIQIMQETRKFCKFFRWRARKTSLQWLFKLLQWV